MEDTEVTENDKGNSIEPRRSQAAEHRLTL